MRKKLQEKIFEASYFFELIISLIVGIAILFLSVRLVMDSFVVISTAKDATALMHILDDAIVLAIGAELIKMLCKHTPETVIEVLAFALARQLIVGHASPIENIITVVAIAVLFIIRRFLLNRQDMLETPDGFVKVSKKNQENTER